MKKRRKLKYKNILKLILIIIAIILFIKFITTKKSPFQLKLNIESIEYGEEFNKDMIKSLTYNGKDIKDTSEYEFKYDKLGKNDLIIKYDNKTYTIKINVIDSKKPEIKLKGDMVYLILNEEYKELGYDATDNYDGEITDKVEVINEVDNKKIGEYKIIYKVKDTSENETIKERKVIVTDKSPLDMNIKEFKLDGYYDNVILKETNEMEDKHLKDFVFVGDSIPLYYAEYEGITGHQIWNKNGINPETIKTSNININYGNDGEMLVIDAFKKYKPKYALITLGSNSAAWMKVEYFISEYKELIKQIQEVSKDTKIIIQSIPPVSSKLDIDSALNNKKINNYNYYLLKMCSELNIDFLNSATALKDINGTCKTGYCQSDGIHQTKDGIIALVKYLKNHFNVSQ